MADRRSARALATPRRAAAAASRLDAALGIAADASDGDTSERLHGAHTRLRWFRRVLLAWGVARTVVWTTLEAPLHPPVLAAILAVLAAGLGLAFAPRREAFASRVALPALLAQLALTFPLTPNHFFLELYATAVLAFADRERHADELVLAGLRWLTAIVLFITGCQKLAYGHYWHGDFLAFMVGRGDRFADLFVWVLPPADVERLASYDPFRGGSGPYRVTSVPFALASNVVWVAELALPIGLLAARTRLLATVVAMLFIAALQLGAREAGFALLFLNLLALFAPASVARPFAGLSLAMLGIMGLAAVGVIPGSALVRAWHFW